ncbi:RNA polymerase sigma factor [Cohnella nanjingensis]|uniref:RNA polymerase subunit sigma-70 n=1 Tax=Cohnella nanjingensis TaxID=1387779 RepID=A0A7X0VE81_9BACL|nr:DUF6596 domain-containing protein [Cohnella nanjingensis]MBB6669279.1 RNA polymerase subunit sigma-70 [Cohnella nanjingensis]
MSAGRNARDTIDRAVRESYGRLIAYLAVRWRDVAAAEDALADAVVAALESWPRAGVPDKPEAWLLTAARRRLIDGARRASLQQQTLPALLAMTDRMEREGGAADVAFPDERLQMLFLCAHPDIDPAMRTPLMLNAVLGIDAARIASAFIVKPATMGQRLTRVKAKIREDRIQFELPDAEALPQRIDAVLEAIYAAYGSGWDDLAGVDPRRKGLTEEAISLGRLLVRFMPEEPEAQGLLAFMLHGEARREARRSETGSYVPLLEQEVSRWSVLHIEEAERCLNRAAQAGRIGRFQLEAAIQSVHAQRARTGRVEWEAIGLLYEGLVRLAPTIGSLVGRAAAVAEARGAETGLRLLEAIPSSAVEGYQPYWALRAHLLVRMRRREEARAAYRLAIGLCSDPAVRAYLYRQSAFLNRWNE